MLRGEGGGDPRAERLDCQQLGRVTSIDASRCAKAESSAARIAQARPAT